MQSEKNQLSAENSLKGSNETEIYTLISRNKK